MTTTQTTRRALVAGLAVAPLAGVPAIAGAVIGDDPIFAAFAEHESAQAAEDLAWKACSDLNDALQAALNAAGLSEEKLFTRRRLEACRKMGLCSTSDYERALAALEGRESEYQKVEAAIEDAEDAANDAREETNDAQISIFETTPTTRAGAARLLRFIADFLDEEDVVNDNLVGDMVGDAIRNAVAVLDREA